MTQPFFIPVNSAHCQYLFVVIPLRSAILTLFCRRCYTVLVLVNNHAYSLSDEFAAIRSNIIAVCVRASIPLLWWKNCAVRLRNWTCCRLMPKKRKRRRRKSGMKKARCCWFLLRRHLPFRIISIAFWRIPCILMRDGNGRQHYPSQSWQLGQLYGTLGWL